MCGRFVVYGKIEDIEKAFKARKMLSEIAVKNPAKNSEIKNFNVAPGQNTPVVISDGKANSIVNMRWGLVPSWTKDEKIGYKMINARSEGIEEKPSYSRPFKTHRCLIVASGFYEWKDKQPNYITLKDRKLFGMAGIYDEWHHDGQVLNSFSIITTSPNKFMSKIHDRMPVIITKEKENNYLADVDSARKLLIPTKEELTSWNVDARMNSPAYNKEDCIKPLPNAPSLDNY